MIVIVYADDAVSHSKLYSDASVIENKSVRVKPISFIKSSFIYKKKTFKYQIVWRVLDDYVYSIVQQSYNVVLNTFAFKNLEILVNFER